MASGFEKWMVGSTGRKYGCWMFVRQCTTVGMPRVFSNTDPGELWKNCVVLVSGTNVCPPMENSVVVGKPAGSICCWIAPSTMVYSLRITLPNESLITVGAKVRGIGSCVANCGMVVGSSGTWFGEGGPAARTLWTTTATVPTAARVKTAWRDLMASRLIADLGAAGPNSLTHAWSAR